MTEEYESFDPSNPTPDLVRMREEVASADRSRPIAVQDYGPFTLLLHLGYPRIHYRAEIRPSDGAYFWITRKHARAIGKALRGHLCYFALSFTTFEEQAAVELAGSVDSEVRIDELVLAHRSGDEATHSEAFALARWVTRVEAATLRWWATEFDPGCLDVFCQELEELGNRWLRELEICDISKPEPEDRLLHQGLELLVARNRQLRECGES